MGTIGKLVHYSVDLALLSGLLAGVRRSTGLTPRLEDIQQKELKGAAQQYLGFGEWLIDSSAAFMSASTYFVRK